VTIDQTQIQSIHNDLSNWVAMNDISKRYPQFTHSQIKRLFWLREQKAGLSRCYRQIGKRGFVNVPLFSMWMSGLLPEQQEANTTDS
jgi:hypothetical protein